MISHRHLQTGWLLLLLCVSGRAYRLDLFGRNSVPQEGDVRLFGTESVSEGRVEVYHDGKWGTVCDDKWDVTEAQVVCRQLNFPGAKSVVVGKDYGQAPGPIWLDEIKCTGTEKQLVSCKFNVWGVTDCTHKEDVGVICETGNNNMTISDSPHFLDHSIHLSDDLGKIYDNGIECNYLMIFQSPTGNTQEDGTPEMTETTICTHKIILMQLPFFSFSAGSNTSTVQLSKPCQTHLNSFVRYLYTRKIDVTFSSALCIHQLASDLGVKHLMEDIGRLFSKILPDDASFNTQVSLYQYAVETGDLILQENCAQYLAWNYQNLTRSPAWSDLPVELLQALLTRSDLVAPDEYFVLQTVESWITEKSDSTSLETQVDLLRLVRFPMISAEKLYILESSSPLYKTHRNVYLDSMLKALQFNVLLFSNLSANPNFKADSDDYKPRIYISETWSTTLNPSHKESQRMPSNPIRDQYSSYNSRNRYDRYGYMRYPTANPYYASGTSYTNKLFKTPYHNSLLFKDKMASWEARVFKNQRECSNNGLRCESVPAAKLARQDYYISESNILFRNRLLLMCQNKYICQIQGFKGNLAYTATNETQVPAYPCPDDKYAYVFAVRPEYV
ncbi:galectin-3-binding protein B [Kryptolebias marmoratus]|uniref:Galectin-3-binding protein B-like n=1 Tax=Kryptolebias marmoratus TaxID=37003 RepID=A0A3Q3AC92_KRYMA|nr:galectin-3-binding protein B [Kryptolebias marmoratus]